MAKKKSREYHSGENNSGHYNFVIVDRELLFCTDENGKNVRSALKLSLPAIGLYAVIKAHAIDKNFCFPSLLVLKKMTGATKETLIKYTRELASAGLIVVEKHTGNAGRPQNVYVIPSVEKERLRMETIMGTENKGRHIEPLDETGSQRSGKQTLKVGETNLQRSAEPTVNRLNNKTNKLEAVKGNSKILFSWEDWEFLDSGIVVNIVTGKDYPVRWKGFSFPLDICMLIDENYPLY